jgi:hypothetical protein
MPLPSEGPWSITIGALAGVPLNFTNITDNSVSGEFGSTEFSGFFDETSQTLTFSDAATMSKGSTTGIVFTPFTVYQATLLQVGSGPYYLLAGVSYVNSGPGGPVANTWYAQYPAPVTPPPTTHTPTTRTVTHTVTFTGTVRTPIKTIT